MPIPVTSENWEVICNLYKKIAKKTTPPVAIAMQHIHKNITLSHSLKSKTFSLKKLIKDKLDPAFKSWLLEMGYKQKSFLLYLENNLEMISEDQYSEIHPYEVPNFPAFNIHGDDDLTRINRGWQLSKYPDYPQLNFHDVAMTNARSTSFENFVKDIERQKSLMENDISIQSHTTDTLRYFLNICKFLSPEVIKVAEIARTSQDEIFSIATKTKNKRRPRKLAKKIAGTDTRHNFLQFQLHDGIGICLACDLQTEEVTARNMLKTSTKLTLLEKRQLADADEITHKKGYSQLYCIHHSDVNNRAGNTKALRDRPYFLSLLSAMHRVELCYRVDEDLVCRENWRRFSALATENRTCRKHLHKIFDLTPILYNNDFDHSSRSETGDEIFNHVLAIYKKLGLTPEQSEPFNPTHIDYFEKNREISNGPFGGTLKGTKMILALTASKFEITSMPNLKDRKIKTPRKSRPLKLRASVPPTAPAP
jgi:hypothetical protein